MNGPIRAANDAMSAPTAARWLTWLPPLMWLSAPSISPGATPSASPSQTASASHLRVGGEQEVIHQLDRQRGAEFAGLDDRVGVRADRLGRPRPGRGQAAEQDRQPAGGDLVQGRR